MRGNKTEIVFPEQERRERSVGKTKTMNMFAAIGPGGKVFLKRLPDPNTLGPKHCRYAVRQPAPQKKTAKAKVKLTKAGVPRKKPGRKRKAAKDLAINKKERRGMDSEAFIDHILKSLRKTFKGNNWTLIVDNATPHVSNETKNWCEQHGFNVLRLSPRSPDINITENFWAALAQAAARRGEPYDLDELERWLHEIVATMDLSHLYDTLRPRTHEVMLQKGKYLTGRWRSAAARRNDAHLKSLRCTH
jgi:transposase